MVQNECSDRGTLDDALTDLLADVAGSGSEALRALDSSM